MPTHESIKCSPILRRGYFASIFGLQSTLNNMCLHIIVAKLLKITTKICLCSNSHGLVEINYSRTLITILKKIINHY